ECHHLEGTRAGRKDIKLGHGSLLCCVIESVFIRTGYITPPRTRRPLPCGAGSVSGSLRHGLRRRSPCFLVFVVMAYPGHPMRQVSFIGRLRHQVERLIEAVHPMQPAVVTMVIKESPPRVAPCRPSCPR